MIRNLVPPKLYIDGFPKSGLHLAIRMALPMFQWANKETVWYGTNPWTLERYHLDRAVDALEQIKPGTMLMGHTGYMEELHQLFDALRIAMVLVYRDLRDVAVSQTHHILNDQDGALKHQGRKDYADNFDDVLMQVIKGIERWPGVVERWESYEPWMNLPFVFPVRFRDMVHKPKWCAKRFFEWVVAIAVGQTGEESGYMDRELQKMTVDHMVFEMAQKQLSTTFRKGKVGSWKREFRPEHVTAFKEMDKENALLRLGFVKQADW